jgi:hypothetical protein
MLIFVLLIFLGIVSMLSMNWFLGALFQTPVLQRLPKFTKGLRVIIGLWGGVLFAFMSYVLIATLIVNHYMAEGGILLSCFYIPVALGGIFWIYDLSNTYQDKVVQRSSFLVRVVRVVVGCIGLIIFFSPIFVIIWWSFGLLLK